MVKPPVIVRQFSVDKLPLLLLSPENVNVISGFSVWGKGLAMVTRTDERQINST